MSQEYLVAIPVFNEQRHLLSILAQARGHCPDILVIDDGSTDSTPNLLAETPSVAVIRHQQNRGYGASLADAFAYAVERRFRWLITMDCDLQHEPSFIPQFQAAAERDRHDLISGSRYLRVLAGNDAPPVDRRRINARITATLNQRLKLDITDAFCGFKAYRVATLSRLRITVPGYAMPIQLWVQAARARFRIAELPVRLIYNDPTRHFGGALDDPGSRYAHYIEVLERELNNQREATPCSHECGVTVA